MPAPIGLPQPLTESPVVERARELVKRPTDATPKGEFAERLAELVTGTDEAMKGAGEAIQALAEGRSHDLHGTLIAAERAGVQLRLLGTVRNKAIEAYREIMRMGG